MPHTPARKILTFTGSVPRDAAVDAWLGARLGPLGDAARHWFDAMRACGDDVRELVHDGCPVACVEDAPFAYVNVFTAHLNVGFFHGDALADPTRLLVGTGKYMRHVKIGLDAEVDAATLRRLIGDAYLDIKARLARGD